MATTETVKQKLLDELETLIDKTLTVQIPYKSIAETLEILDRIGSSE